jgi:hypothetical protein
MDAYVEWRNQCSAVWVAYSHWAAAGASDAELRYRAYAVALDQEERASEIYAGLIRRVRDLVTGDLKPVADLAPAGERRS